MDQAQGMAVATTAFLVIVHEVEAAESLMRKRRRRKRRQLWTAELYKNRQRNTQLLKDLRYEDGSKFRNFTRMSEADFMFLLNEVRPLIEKKDTTFRKAIPAEDRLAITMRFLASGDSYASLESMFRVFRQLISRIVPDVCAAIVSALKHNVKMPTTADEWKEVADGFEKQWNFPNCVGCLDGKHVVLVQPAASASEFINYKGTFSIVLMAIADADYNFIFVDIGCQGRISDGGVFNNCELYKQLESNRLNLPAPKPLPGRINAVPYVFLGDSAFTLFDHLMKPYAGIHPKGSPMRIFNYRLSRAHRIIENAFGILSGVFRVLRKPMLLQPDKAALIVMTTVCLHNFLRRSKTSRHLYTPPGLVDCEAEGELVHGTWRQHGPSPSFTHYFRNVPIRTKASAQRIRDEFIEYFCSNGAVSWQNTHC